MRRQFLISMALLSMAGCYFTSQPKQAAAPRTASGASNSVDERMQTSGQANQTALDDNEATRQDAQVQVVPSSGAPLSGAPPSEASSSGAQTSGAQTSGSQTTGAQTSGAQTSAPTFTGPPAPAELKVLSPFVGKWTTEGIIKPSLRHKEGFTSKGETTVQWIHNGHFLKMDGFGDSKQGRFESTTIIGYDSTAKVFRQFTFSSDGQAAHANLIGNWDERTRTMTWEADRLPAGWTAATKVAMTADKDQFVWTLLLKNDRGETVRDVTQTATRKK